MKYALVIYEALKRTDHQAQTAWINATSTARDKTSKSEKVETLSEGCFLCDLGNGLHDLHYIVGAASAYGIQTRTLFFENAPQFVISPPRT